MEGKEDFCALVVGLLVNRNGVLLQVFVCL